jgi:hypothetical protein
MRNKKMKNICVIILTAWICFSFSGFGLAMEDMVNIHGFMSQGYMKTEKNNYIVDSEDGTFQFNEMGINFTTLPVDRLMMGIQFFARDFGSIGNDAITVDWAFADYRLKDWLGFRAGRIKNPMGLYNETRDVDMLRTSILLPVSPYDEPYRESGIAVQGVGLYGDINSYRFGTLNYQLLLGTNNIVSDGGTALFINQGRFDISDIESKYIISGALVWTDPTGYLRLGGTAYFTELDVTLPNGHFDIDDIEAYVLSLEFTWDRIVFSYEYFWGHTSLHLYIDGNEVTGGFVPPYDPLGYYGAISYRINDVIEVGYFRMEYFSREDDRDGSEILPVPGTDVYDFKEWQKEDVLSLRFDINENWLIKLETHYIDGAVKVNQTFNPDGFNRYWWMHLAKISYKF